MPSFNSKTNPTDFPDYIYRAENINLRWCNQITDIIKENYNSYCKQEKIRLNDYGCCYGQLLKEITRRKQDKEICYLGYDYDIEFLKLAQKIFPNKSKRFRMHDLERQTGRETEISVCSATLEHLDNAEDALERIIKVTNELIIIRAYTGNQTIREAQRNIKITPIEYNINQLDENWIKKEFNKNGFEHRRYEDEATNRSQRREIHKGSGILREMYIHVGKRK